MKQKLTICIVILSFIVAYFAKAQDRGEIISAVNDGSKYAINVLLDDEGKSRCDYNWTEGKWYPYEPAWHTGQLILGLLESYVITKNEKYLGAAEKAGNWWISLKIKDHPKLSGMLNAIHGDDVDFIVFATISDGSAGLFELTRVTGDPKFAQTATDAGKWMLNNMYLEKEGMFYDSVDPLTGDVLTENSPFWKEKKEQSLNDVARPNNEGSLFKDMYEFTGEEKYKKVFINLCNSLVEKQGPEGLWMDFTPNHKQDGGIHPRFNIWYAESLIEGYVLTADERYLNAALRTARFYQTLQQNDGTIYYTNYLDGKINKNSICGSAVSFAGIMWLRLKELGFDEFDLNVEKSLNWILKNRFSFDHPDKNLAGSFFETRVRSKKGKMWVTVRDIATSFGLRFLTQYYKQMK